MTTSQVGTSEECRKLGVRYVTSPARHDVAFSICTLVANQDRYDRLLASFAANGFDAGNSEFIAIDNRGQNRFDGFSGLRRALMECKGKYILFTHDDIELLEDGADDLLACLEALDAQDPSWTVAGNAGYARDGLGRTQFHRHLSDPGGDRRVEMATEVETLDENFLILSRDRMVLGSLDLEGFHFYASDLCLMSRIMGGRAYVVPFYLRHNSLGDRGDAFKAARERFARKYRQFFVGRRLRTPCAPIRFGWAGLLDTSGPSAPQRASQGA